MRLIGPLRRRFSPIGIQLIPEHLRAPLFGGANLEVTSKAVKNRDKDHHHQPNSEDSPPPPQDHTNNAVENSGAKTDGTAQRSKWDAINGHLKRFGLNAAEPEQLADNHLNQLKLPPLCGADVAEHFFQIGRQYSDGYKALLAQFLLASYQIPPLPSRWELIPGSWVKYQPPDERGRERYQVVPYPDADSLVFDVEVTVADEGLPAMATALSPTGGWYSWTSPRFADPARKEMIPMGRSGAAERLIIGHMVSFDRSFVAEQYDIHLDRTRFLDTLSLHVAVCGLTSHQRGIITAQRSSRSSSSASSSSSDSSFQKAYRKGSGEWTQHSSLYSLADCLKFHCGETVDKEPRNIFMTGRLADVRDNFQNLMSYCAKDVIATTKVLRRLAPDYLDRFPHPATFAGMLEMSVMYLPLKEENWRRYIEAAQEIYDDREREVSQALKRLANSACASTATYSEDVFLWDLDWSTRMPRIRKPKPEPKRKRRTSSDGGDLAAASGPESAGSESQELQVNIGTDGRITYSSPLIEAVRRKTSDLYKIQPIMTGFPMWYREFCESPTGGDQNWDVGPYKVSTGMRSVPKLMRLLWDGFPLHHDRAHGWGYLVPMSKNPPAEFVQAIREGVECTFPLGALHRLCGHLVDSAPSDLWDEVTAHHSPVHVDMDIGLEDDVASNKFAQYMSSLSAAKSSSRGSGGRGGDIGGPPVVPPGQIMDLIPGVIFKKLPHRNGFKFNVGNPLGKDFIHKVDDRTLTSLSESAGWILDLNASLSYWRNAHKRIKDQLVWRWDPGSGGHFSAIVPRVLVAGTVTRRAVEKTWLTASNIIPDRLGCELKSMISAPDGYHFVGADVDSQELWIASLLGDSAFFREHGCTALGWMTLRGTKGDGTDMHSRTAALVNISRSEAKVLNYARIYGAGVEFVQRFLMQNDHALDRKTALEKAKAIYSSTKGRREALKTDKSTAGPVAQSSEPSEAAAAARPTHWVGGSESFMFNALERIASRPSPRTPFLGARMSKALEPRLDRSNIYLTSRLNWVVQSSAVDFIHLIIVAMRHFMDHFEIRGRFSISIHDEVRYLIQSEDRYRAALALHLANLYVRSFFAHQVGLHDLPLSIAFFESVEIDRVVRKNVQDDCVTLSNPHGLQLAFGIPFGETVDMRDLLVKKKVKLVSASPTVSSGGHGGSHSAESIDQQSNDYEHQTLKSNDHDHDRNSSNRTNSRTEREGIEILN